MSLRFGRLLAAFALLVYLPAAGFAQPNSWNQFTIELKSDDPLIATNYACELEMFRSHDRIGIADLRSDDTFTFRNVPFGEYRVSITDRRGGLIYEEMLTIGGTTSLATIHLLRPKSERPPSGPVSLARLQHPPTRKAFSAFAAAQKLSEAGDYRHAAEELERAIAISPDYADAYTNLAVQHMRLGEYQRAVDEMLIANRLAKPGPVQMCNLAYAQAKLERFDDAIASARASLRLDGDYPQAHYVLGALLAQHPATLREALQHLERAAKTLPSAESTLRSAMQDWKRLEGQRNYGGN